MLALYRFVQSFTSRICLFPLVYPFHPDQLLKVRISGENCTRQGNAHCYVRVTFKNAKEQPLNVPIIQSRPTSSWWPKAERSWTNSNYQSAISQPNLRTSNCRWIEVFVWLRRGRNRWIYLNNSSKRILEEWYSDPNLGEMTGNHLFQGSTNLSRKSSTE